MLTSSFGLIKVAECRPPGLRLSLALAASLACTVACHPAVGSLKRRSSAASTFTELAMGTCNGNSICRRSAKHCKHGDVSPVCFNVWHRSKKLLGVLWLAIYM
mmetsp:Transcript_80574/g.142453  ORF Transcript_80574/g.142453 Transcript_80574/m.142453 type:complete len:103 (+) Transcript_80574:125-433(+)